MDYKELLEQAYKIKCETKMAANTACRIGTLFSDIIKALEANSSLDESVSKDVDKIKDQITDLTGQCDDFSKRISTLEYRLDVEVPQKFREQLALIDANKDAIGKNTIDIASNLNQINLLWDAIKANSAEIDDFMDEVRKINERIDNLNISITNLLSRIIDVETSVSNLSSSVDNRFSNVNVSIENINTTLQDHSGKLTNLNSKDQELQGQIDDLKDLINDLTGGSSDLSEEINNLKSRVSILEASFDNLDNSIVVGGFFENDLLVLRTKNLKTGVDSEINVNVPTASTTGSGFMSSYQYTKLDGIQEGAEVNVQSDWDMSDSADDSFIKNKPVLANVATSGSYNDLSDKPTIPPEQVNSDWNATGGKAQILNKPTIPAAQQQTDWNATSGITSIKNKPALATVATSGSYNDLKDKPASPEIPDQVNADWNATSGVAQILNKPNLATVATSGSYNDLTNKPTIPSPVTLPPVNVVDSFPSDVSGQQDGTIYIVPGSGGDGGGGDTPEGTPYLFVASLIASNNGLMQTEYKFNEKYIERISASGTNAELAISLIVKPAFTEANLLSTLKYCVASPLTTNSSNVSYSAIRVNIKNATIYINPTGASPDILSAAVFCPLLV